MAERIIGIDVARSLAIMGMIFVNFKMVFGADGNDFLKNIFSIIEGKAAALFVVLAGIGIGFLMKSAAKKGIEYRGSAYKRLLKRAVFLFIIGTLYLPIWPADILHFYGLYIVLTALIFYINPKLLLWAAGLLIVSYPCLMFFFSYDTGWNFDTFEYAGFWTISGFLRNLLYNGFHPVVPWAAFMLFGAWYGLKDLRDRIFLKKGMWVSLLVFSIMRVVSIGAIFLLSEGDPITAEELTEIMGTSPMPPLPIYMIAGISSSVFVLNACILFCFKYQENNFIQSLKKMGQMALTLYVAHVVIGMLIVDVLAHDKMGKLGIHFSFLYALGFINLSFLFSVLWLKRHKLGPLESIMRKWTD